MGLKYGDILKDTNVTWNITVTEGSNMSYVDGSFEGIVFKDGVSGAAVYRSFLFWMACISLTVFWFCTLGLIVVRPNWRDGIQDNQLSMSMLQAIMAALQSAPQH